MDFREYITKKIIKSKYKVVEFGPLDRPIVKKSLFPRASYADVRPTEDVKKLYTENQYLKSTGVSIDTDTIVGIDYVIKSDYKNSFKNEKFDVAVLSHVIEHMPDIIKFFQEIKSILNSKGRLILIYPDSRYSFDHYRNGTRFIDAYNTFKKNKINADAIFDFSFNVIKGNIPADYWSGGETGEVFLPRNKFEESAKLLKINDLSDAPDDMHFWPFADYQFLKFLYDLDRAGLSGFKIEEFYATQFNTQEFMVILSLDNSGKDHYGKYQEIAQKLRPEKKWYKLINDLDRSKKECDNLTNENHKLIAELNDIKSSKKWKMMDKVGNSINIIKRMH